MLTVHKVVNLIKKLQPSSPKQVEDFIPLDFVGQGSFREVYSVGDLGIVIKFPLQGPGCVSHAVAEIEAFQELKKKAPKDLRPHIPRLYFTDKETGVIIMKKYQPYDGYGLALTKKLRKFFKSSGSDYGFQNFGKNGNRLVVLDLGII